MGVCSFFYPNPRILGPYPDPMIGEGHAGAGTCRGWGLACRWFSWVLALGAIQIIPVGKVTTKQRYAEDALKWGALRICSHGDSISKDLAVYISSGKYGL